MQTTQMKSSFAGNAQALGATNGGRTVAFFKKAPASGTKQIKKAVQPAKKAATKVVKKATPVFKKAVPALKKAASKAGPAGQGGVLLPAALHRSSL